MDPRRRLEDLQVSLNSGLAAADTSDVRRSLEGLSQLASEATEVSSEAATLAAAARERLEADSLVAECGEADPFASAYIFYQGKRAHYRCTHDRDQGGPHTWPV